MIHRRQQKQKKINTAAKNCVCATFDFQSSFLSETILLNQVFLFRNFGMGDRLRTPCAAGMGSVTEASIRRVDSVNPPTPCKAFVSILGRSPLDNSVHQWGAKIFYSYFFNSLRMKRWPKALVVSKVGP